MTTTNPDGLPELPEPWTIRYHDDATGREIGPPTPLYTADQMHQYARDYAAALSQPAGVPDGWKLVPVEPTEVMCEAAMSSLGWTRSEAAAKTAPITPASPMMEGSMKVWSAMLATAPAASGAHPDALPDGTLSKSTAKRVEVLAAASVGRMTMAEYTTGHCPNHNQPGGCQLHNLQCGWPNCDRRQVQPQPPSAASVSVRERAAEDSARLDYIERTFSGMTNRERYLPVTMIWGKGANGRTLREACDKYMAKDVARAGERG